MNYTITRSQVWHNGITIKDGIPDVDQSTQFMFLREPVAANRVIHSTGNSPDGLWLMQLGQGEHAWYSWIPAGSVSWQEQCST